MGAPADPNVTPEVIKPEWFFYVTFRWLKLFTGTVAEVKALASRPGTLEDVFLELTREAP